ncbi:hypothetical protein Cch01nite_38280 [Cellulomonas chitinilytica]|uniref:PPM-type phosphatase domain-containing protein n=1 Tax=Cellulomonas chitinilytica TaxID=398759 RepID=A0A919P893_9CELL|nr:protein phosphatase 2C domain-containing protein [Cellulomonas chitinilytica]GIG23104.1 hypothetical protein Cch01nite_38280 [Cellulomonas chitinilytica]
MDHVVSVACPACGAAVHDSDRFCEGCGAALVAPAAPAEPSPEPSPQPSPEPSAADGAGAPCRSCGGVVAADGYCEQCGALAVSERDHWSERPAPHVGGVCDRGRRHARNEDAMALHADGALTALVVCDGVSSAPDSDLASLAAARAARDVLAAGAVPATVTEAARPAAWSALLVDAAAAADAAIRGAVGDRAGRAEPPSCTFVAAVVDGPLVVTGWLGDSRTYWLPDAGTPRQLSADDSGANELIARGVPRAQAESSPTAHAITRWLGPDAPDVVPQTTATRTQGPGWVLVCSDGLWNYCSEAADLDALVRDVEARVGSAPDAIAAELVTWANAQGGHDNITVALARPTGDSLQAEPTGSAANVEAAPPPASRPDLDPTDR